MAATGMVDVLSKASDIGPKIASSLCSWFSNSNNTTILQKLITSGLQFKVKDKPATTTTTTILSGKNFVITGTFNPPERRRELEKLVEDNGGKLQTSVNSKTSYLISGLYPGSSKIEKAEKLGINTINEETFLNMLKDGK